MVNLLRTSLASQPRPRYGRHSRTGSSPHALTQEGQRREYDRPSTQANDLRHPVQRIRIQEQRHPAQAGEADRQPAGQ